ncbi:metallophosphoesterase [Candidatus Omnitrophus magneticus]|uniref:Metallophosphoesterase n=1 Tax=Candidatus Omnitrophus magneticus TaxID=1609969 RepID=A0A0F0CTT0_9BACT|nr:metallophosphoesterase [Candidatus Omnitrophus magneticus]
MIGRKMRILFLGDIVGSPGREIIEKKLSEYKKKERIDFVIANGENAASGSGIIPRIAEQLISDGVDVITSGDHIWKRKEIYDYLKCSKRIVRPANYPKGVLGWGSTIVSDERGRKVGVINLIGRVFMDPMDCPFARVLEELEFVSKETSIIIVDVHAEATSEKVALGWFLDGKVSAVIGTHTHIQTADEKILPKGTAYITDAGMTGPYESVIGRKCEQIIERFRTQLPTKFEVADGGVEMHGVLLEINDKTGKAESIVRVQQKL